MSCSKKRCKTVFLSSLHTHPAQDDLYSRYETEREILPVPLDTNPPQQVRELRKTQEPRLLQRS
ncbi:MAG: hypothetical protein GKR92_05320 [Gammaproteobacteria bacterium]|nr:MAG: hypothetical protein GKR92_05320 [Gammaproteobacteria bacterium]